MKLQDYNAAANRGFTRQQKDNIVLEVLIILDLAKDILFDKDGNYKPLKWRSFKRWYELGKLALRIIFFVIRMRG